MASHNVLFQPGDTFKHLLTRLNAGSADVAINLLPFEHPHKGGMVDFDADRWVRSIVEKPTYSHLNYS